MHITLLTSGSRGDVEPYVALGAGLKAAGHVVRLATHANFEGLAARHRLEFAKVEGNPRDAIESDLGQAWLASGKNALTFARRMAEIMRPMMRQGLDDCWNACRDTELVLYSVLGWLAAHHVLEKSGTPGCAAYLQPATPTRAFPSMASLWHGHLGSLYNRLTYMVGEQVYWQIFRGPVNRARRAVLGLPPMGRLAPFAATRRRREPVLYGFSPTVVPKPPDWQPWIEVAGYWFLPPDEGWQPPPEVLRFLEAGPPPVYVGYGSMHARSAPDLTSLVVEALAMTGRRGVLLTGWGALTRDGLPDFVLPVESIPHEWLFPRCTAVVHHGGAGTTAAGLRAGRPTIVTPFFADQPFWGSRIYRLGAGPKPILVRRLTAPRLAAAIRAAVDDGRVRERAADVGKRIRAEDGVARAVEFVHRHFAR